MLSLACYLLHNSIIMGNWSEVRQINLKRTRQNNYIFDCSQADNYYRLRLGLALV